MSPPRDDHGWEVIGKKGVWQVRAINSYSDGEQRQWPGKPKYRPTSEERYLIQLAKAWVTKDRGGQPDIQYYLDKLPDGYALFETDQPNSKTVYKRLFGHPSGKFYDSTVRFEVHFLWLTSGMVGNCTCILCGHHKPTPIIPRIRGLFEKPIASGERRSALAAPGSKNSSRSASRNDRASSAISARPQRQIKAVGAPYAVDEEGNEDVFKECIKKLLGTKGSTKGMEDNIREINSIDWRAEHSWGEYGKDLIQQSLTLISLQHSFVPRVGELVMWCPNFLDGHYLMLDEEKGELKFYSFDQKCFHGFPAWRAGVVTAVPSAIATDGPVDFPDIQDMPTKRTALNTAGFRVETFPDPNDEVDKKASKQYRYVPLRNIRPLSHWQILLRGIAREKWHASIEYALTCMTSISLMEKWWFHGDWPQGAIFCKGIYIGSELIVVGDSVRIVPEANQLGKASNCTDVLIVDSIRLNLLNITPDDALPNTPLLSSTSSITLDGRAYTRDIHRHYQMQGQESLRADQRVVPLSVPREEVKMVFRSVGTGEYGSWYYLHDPTKHYEISYDRVLGRLHEAAAVRLWTGQMQRRPRRDDQSKIRPSLDFDMNAILEGRLYATQVDARLDAPSGDQLSWFWADTRAEALDVETMNGCATGRYHYVRDPATLEQWRTHLKILNGQSVTSDLFKLTTEFPPLPGSTRGRKPGSKVVDGKVYQPGDEGYDNIVDKEVSKAASTPRHHKISTLAEAALVSTDEEDGEGEGEEEAEEDGEEDEDEGEDVFEDAAEEAVESVEQDDALTKALKLVKDRIKARTKEQIMSNAEAYSSETSEDDDWYDQPPALVRGGTEESSGGDYDPEAGTQTQPQAY